MTFRRGGFDAARKQGFNVKDGEAYEKAFIRLAYKWLGSDVGLQTELDRVWSPSLSCKELCKAVRAKFTTLDRYGDYVANDESERWI